MKKRRASRPALTAPTPPPPETSGSVASPVAPTPLASQRWLAITIVVIVFVAAYAHRPFLLGFYSDDFQTYLNWGSWPEPTRIAAMWQFLANRAPQIVALYLGFLVFGLSETGAQIYSAVLVLANAAVLFAILHRLAHSLDARSPELCASLALAAWIVAPWSLGYTAWISTASVNLTGQFFVLQSLLIAMRMQATSVAALAACGALHFVGCWTYEAYYGQPLWLTLIALLGRLPGESLRRDGLRIFAALTGGQFLAVLQNRLTAYLGIGNQKTLADWFLYFESNLFVYPRWMLDAFNETSAWVESSFLLLAALAVGGLACGAFSAGRPAYRRLALMVICLAAIVTNLAVLSLAGHGYFPHGLVSRTTIAGTTFGALIILGLLAAASSGPRAIFISAFTSASILVVALWGAQQHRILQWHGAHLEQQRLVALVPLEEYRRRPSDAFVLFLPPHYYRDHHGADRHPGLEIPIFATGSDFHVALERRLANEEGRPFLGLREGLFFPAYENLALMTWDGENITSGGYNLKAKNLWIWNPASRSFARAGLGLRIEYGVLRQLDTAPGTSKTTFRPLLEEITAADMAERRLSRSNLRIKGRPHQALYLHAPAQISWNLDLAADETATLEFLYGLQEAAWSASHDGIDAVVTVTADSGTFEVFRGRTDPANVPADRSYKPASIPLERFRGKSVQLTITVDPRRNNANDHSLIVDPQLVSIR